MKIDLHKAYDCISWSGMTQILEAFKSPPKFVSCILTCATAAHFALSLNKELFDCFDVAKGIRQRYPFSPLLIVLIVEYLTRCY